MSLMMVSSAWADERTMPTNSRCSGVRSVASTSSVMPMMPFMGVRISWLMLARNSLFARLAASAASRACSSSMRPASRSATSLTIILDNTAMSPPPAASFTTLTGNMLANTSRSD
jgi:hypothetical protein